MTMYLLYAALVVKHYYASYRLDWGYSQSRREELPKFGRPLLEQLGLEVVLTGVGLLGFLGTWVLVLMLVELIVYTLACFAERHSTYANLFITHFTVEVLCAITLAATVAALAHR